MTKIGTVDAEGNSAVPAEIFDMSAMGEQLDDPELEKRIRGLFELNQAIKARYKIGLYFTGDRSAHAAYKGFITLWSTGSGEGDGDRSVYLCPQRVVNVKGIAGPCNAPLEYGMFTSQGAVCVRCRSYTPRAKLTGQIFARLPTQHWSALVCRVFGILGCNADISISYIHSDIRVATTGIDERGRRDELRDHRNERIEVIYTLARLLQDTGQGRSVSSAIKAFLEA